ncbi:gamma-glutamyltranspeptidase [Camillea tinctor]|nr:gamma-glutamyltranspeptidase [Camillea tinctor]
MEQAAIVPSSLKGLPSTLLQLLVAASPIIAAPPHWLDSEQQVVLQTSTESSHRGAVACESKICSQIGIDLLAQGGNAVDAFIGTQLCVGVTSMYHSGIGGGGFSLIRDQNGDYTVIDYRETAPAAASQEMYQGNVPGSVFGGLSVGVPGELRGLELAHKKFGVLPWKTVVEPAAFVARDGFPVNEDMVRYMERGIEAAKHNFLVEDPSWAQEFAPNGVLLTLGETMYRTRYGETLLQVAKHGADVFYTGPIADATIAAIRKSNGTMTKEDLSGYEALVREPISITYRGFRLFSSSAPSSGAVCLSTLKTMEAYDSADTAHANLTLHRFDEAMRFAYGAHQSLGDPAYVDNATALESRMLSASSAASIRGRILDNATQPVDHYDPERVYTASHHGTSHIVAADASGMAVSSTTTVNLLFGSLILVPETGVVLNDEMNDFSIPGVRNEFGYAPSAANFVRAGKRPLSSITPVVVEKPDGSLYAVVGAAGGSFIISSTTQVVWRLLELGMSMRDAVAEPRFHDQLMPDNAVFEWKFDNATVASMEEKGHNVTWTREGVSAVQGIRVAGDLASDGGFEAVGETRQANSGGLTL